MGSTGNEIEIYFKSGKTRRMIIMNVVESWAKNDLQCFRNTHDETYVIPTKNILYFKDNRRGTNDERN